MKKFILYCLLLAIPVTGFSLETLKLTAPAMEPRLSYSSTTDNLAFQTPGHQPLQAQESLLTPAAAAASKYQLTWMRTNPGVKPYKVLDDLTFVGVPLFLAGWAIKSDKAMFRVNNKEGKKNTQLLTDFKTGIDDYTQFFGPAMVVGLKVGGVEGRSDWGRLLASAGLSYGIMAGFVNGIKYTAKEMRPDGSTANSWPSGHTATSFVGATLLHKEYGLTRSPWYSVAGYGVATATGVMRVLNNRHWVSDVMSGAGIGILSAELGYALGDLIFKGRGLLRNDLVINSENPSFFGISMGVGIGSKDIDFTYEDLQYKELYDEDLYDMSEDSRVQFRASTVVDAEGAYFFNKYIGVGGRFRVRAMSAKSFGQYANISAEEQNDAWEILVGTVYDKAVATGMYEQDYLDMDAARQNGAPITNIGGVVRSDHLAEFTGSVGLYFNLPLGRRFSIGTKALIGRSITQELEIDGFAEGYVKDIDYGMIIENSQLTLLSMAQPSSVKNSDGTYQTYSTEWDYLTLGANNSTSYGTGLSLTYRYKSNFSWRLFCDYDYTKKTFTMTAQPYQFIQQALTENAYALVSTPLTSPFYAANLGTVYKKEKKMNYFTVGLSFLVNL